MDKELLNLLYSEGEDPITYGSKEYNEAYADGLIVSEEEGRLLAPMLDEVVVTADRPGYLDNITTGKMANAYISPAVEALSIPQAAITEGIAEYKDGSGDAMRILPSSIQSLITGKEGLPQRTPSDVIGFGTKGDDGSYHGDTWVEKSGNAVMDIVADPTNLIGVGLVAKSKRALTNAKNLKNVKLPTLRDLSSFANEDAFYRIVRGKGAIDDIVNSGVVRSVSTPSPPGTSLLDRINNRPTAFPSFSKGKVNSGYAKGDVDHYIIEALTDNIKVSTLGRHGKGSTMFPFDPKTGNFVNELPMEGVSVHKHTGDGKYTKINPFKTDGKTYPYGGSTEPIKPGSEEYNQALLDGTLVTEQDGVLTAPMLNNVDVTASDGFGMGTIANAALGVLGPSLHAQYDMVEPVVTPVLDMLGSVQSGMTEGLAYLRGDKHADINRAIPMTGQQRGSNVQRVPSDLYGWGTVDSTGVKTGDTAAQMVGNGLIDTFSDPLDYVGIGLLGKLSTGITSTPKFLKALSNMSFKNSGIIDDVVNFTKDLAIPSRVDNRVNQAKETNTKIRKVYNNLHDDIVRIKNKRDNVGIELSKKIKSLKNNTAYTPIHTVKNDKNVPTGVTFDESTARSLKDYDLDGDVISEVSNGLSPTQRSTTTGEGYAITDFSGGTPVLPKVDVKLAGTDYSYKLDPSGKNVDVTVTENSGIPSMEVNKEYVDVVNVNIHELEKTFPGFKVYGSARGVGEGGLPHVTDDFDGYITQAMYDKHVKEKYPQLKADMDNHTYKHSVFNGESGNIDFNIIQADENGFATGTRATELWRQSDPDSFFKAQAKSAKTGEPVKNPYKPQELIDNIDMTTKTIMDAMESNKLKHILRGDSYLAYGNADKVLEAQSMYVKSLVGGKGYTGPNFLDGNMLDSADDNLELLHKMNYKGDLSVIARDPKRMQAAINDHYINSTVLSRTVTDEPENAFRQWLTQFDGGSAHGAGLNAVRLGTPNWDGNWYGNMQYGIKSKATTPDELLNDLDHATGRNFNVSYSADEKEALDKLLDKHGIDMEGDVIASDNNLLTMLPTYKDKDEKSSKFLEEYSRTTGRRFLSNDGNFGNSSYVSALRFDDELDALGYYGIKDLNLKSKKLRNSVLMNKSNNSRIRITDPKIFKGVKGYKTADPKLLEERFAKRGVTESAYVQQATNHVDRITKFTNKKYSTLAKKEELRVVSKDLNDARNTVTKEIRRKGRMNDIRDITKVAAGGAGVVAASVIASKYAKGEWDKSQEEKIKYNNSPEGKEHSLNRKEFYKSDYYKSVKDDILNGSGLSRSGRSKKHFDKWMAKKNKKSTKFSNGGKVNPFMKIGNY